MLAFVRAGIKSQFAFPSRVITDAIRPVIGMIVPVIVIASVASMSGVQTIFNRSIQELALYYATIALLGTIPAFYVAWDTAGRVDSGRIVVDLVKPVNPQIYYFMWDLGTVITGMIIAMLIIAALAAITGHLANLPAFLIHTVIVTMFWTIENACIGLISAWTYRIQYVQSVINWFVAGILGGMVVPLDVMPEWVQHISHVLPFRYAMYDAANTLIRGADIHPMVILSIWTIMLMIVHKYLHRKALERMEAFGG